MTSVFNTTGRKAMQAVASSSSRLPTTVGRRSLATPVASASPVASSHRIVVVGGGAAGQAASHQLLRTGLIKDPAEILLIDPSETHDYQPGWTLVGAGLKTREELRRPMQELIGDDNRLHFLRDAVTTFEPEQSRLLTRDGRTISYEHLVVCPGLGIKWDAIKGLQERLQEGKNVISIYSYDTCANVYPQIEAMRKGKAIFTQPAGVIKCAGAPQKIMWLGLDHWKGEGLFNQANPTDGQVQITFATGMPTMFGAPKYNAALEQLRKERNVEGLFNHNLTSIDGSVATFSTPASTEGAPAQTVQRNFDFLHVTPPMGPLPFIKDSPLADKATGFVEVDAGTTRHVRYSNVWSIGDSSSLPTSKTAAAITAETPVMVANLASVLTGRAVEEIYDGYTSCPLLTEYGKVMLAEFTYGGKPKETFAPLGFDQSQPSRLFYHLKKDFFPFVYYQSHVKGTWKGPKGWTSGLGSSMGGNMPSVTASRGLHTGQRRAFSTSPIGFRNLPARRPRDPLASAPNAIHNALPTGETLIIRSPPSVSSPHYPATSPTDLPGRTINPYSLPALRPASRFAQKATKTLNAKQIEQVIQMRATGGKKTSGAALARRFGCSPTFVRMVAPASKAQREAHDQKVEEQRLSWGPKKATQRELRRYRRTFW